MLIKKGKVSLVNGNWIPAKELRKDCEKIVNFSQRWYNFRQGDLRGRLTGGKTGNPNFTQIDYRR